MELEAGASLDTGAELEAGASLDAGAELLHPASKVTAKIIASSRKKTRFINIPPSLRSFEILKTQDLLFVFPFLLIIFLFLYLLYITYNANSRIVTKL